MTRREKLDELLATATPLPWEFGRVIDNGLAFDVERDILPTGDYSGPIAIVRSESGVSSNAALIVTAVNALADGDLITREEADAEKARLVEALATLATAAGGWCDYCCDPCDQCEYEPIAQVVENVRGTLAALNPEGEGDE